MKFLCIVLLFACLLTACSKKENAPSMVTPTSTHQTKSTDTTRLIASTFPYCDTFYGHYNEFSQDLYPNNVSGYSRVLVWHYSADSIIFQADSLGYSGFPVTGIYQAEKRNDSNSYALNIQWYSDRTNSYVCKSILTHCAAS